MAGDEMTPDEYLSSIRLALADGIKLYDRKLPGKLKDTESAWEAAMRDVGVEDSPAVRAAVIRSLMLIVPEGKASRDKILETISMILDALVHDANG